MDLVGEVVDMVGEMDMVEEVMDMVDLEDVIFLPKISKYFCKTLFFCCQTFIRFKLQYKIYYQLLSQVIELFLNWSTASRRLPGYLYDNNKC